MKAATALLAILALASPSAATLIHHYEFDTDLSDSAGSETGMGFGDAAVAGGLLLLDGAGDYVEFSAKLVPESGSYSVALFARQDSLQTVFVEMISQGGPSGAPGFYIGHTPSRIIRVSDLWLGTGVAFPGNGAFHHYALVVDSGAAESRLFVDGVLEATLVGTPIATTGATNTRLGRQFDPQAEFFHGALDDVRIYDEALSDDAVALLAGVPEPSTFVMMGVGLVGLAGLGRRARRRVYASS